ncbi:hypothetical protein MKZ38_003010 [Zalerion maritima]|uniref:Uncharacterized protein n=1 Tax=Zalerion maritima TaxID=339359 RepID=A0AAD5RPJ4_9PEZI|nr:hypothetical protein MKZ38_003010 [Zalerion maritima]
MENIHSLRYRIFGPASPDQSEKSHIENQASSREPTIADRFKAAIAEEIPECLSPSQGMGDRKLPKSSSTDSASSTLQFATKLKDTYADECQELHEGGISKLEESHALLLNDLQARIAHIKDQSRKANVTERMKPLSETKVSARTPDNRKIKLTLGQCAEDYRASMSQWQEEMSRVETEFFNAKGQVADAYSQLLNEADGAGTSLRRAIDKAQQNVRLAKEECLEEARKLRKEAEDELREKETQLDSEIQQIQEFLNLFLYGDMDGDEDTIDMDDNDEENVGSDEANK